jgi:hypothetical protein
VARPCLLLAITALIGETMSKDRARRALSLVAASPTHTTAGLVIILAISALLVVVFALCDQGRKHSAFKN